MALDKYHLNLAGEYRVAAELLKRGIFATITYGNKKGADIYAIGPNRQTAVVEVKTSNSQRFVTGFYQKYKDETQEHPDFWVLYRLAVDGDEDFYVLTHQEMAIAQGARNYPDEQLSWIQHAERVIVASTTSWGPTSKSTGPRGTRSCGGAQPECAARRLTGSAKSPSVVARVHRRTLANTSDRSEAIRAFDVSKPSRTCRSAWIASA